MTVASPSAPRSSATTTSTDTPVAMAAWSAMAAPTHHRSHHRQTQAQGDPDDEADEVPRPTPEGEVPIVEPPKPGDPHPDHDLPRPAVPEQGPDVPPGEADLHAAVQALTRAVGYLAGNAPPFVRQAVDEAERALTGLA